MPKTNHTMRVIAGKHRRRLLKSVPAETTRSTRDRVKESLFNMLEPLEQYTHCLDLFAGSGALGIEALSRGVEQVVFVESHTIAYAVLRENIEQLDLLSQSELNQADALTYCRHDAASFDLILLDPPYQSSLIDNVLEMICDRSILKKHGLIAILSSSQTKFSVPPCLTEIKQRAMGVTTVTLLRGDDA